MKKLLVATILALVSNAAFAAGWSDPLTVESAFVENSDLVVIYTSGGGAYTPGCTANAWTFRADSDARRGRAWATVMAALASGQRIRLWYNDTCGTWSFHDATSIMLLKQGS
jgi:hypothetical protein